MAGARADVGQEISVPVQPGPGDPQPHVDSDPGQPRHPSDLGGPDRRAGSLEGGDERAEPDRSEEHTSELQSLMRISYAVFCLKKKKTNTCKAHRHSNDDR